MVLNPERLGTRRMQSEERAGLDGYIIRSVMYFYYESYVGQLEQFSFPLISAFPLSSVIEVLD